MTREERAIKVLINVQSQFQASLDEVDVDEDCKEAEEDNTEIVEALDMAIKALKQEPCDDCVSRQAVNDLYDRYHPTLANHVYEFGEELKALPSVTPKCNPNKNVKTYYFHDDYCPKESEDKE